MAARDLNPGETILVEKAFASVVVDHQAKVNSFLRQRRCQRCQGLKNFVVDKDFNYIALPRNYNPMLTDS